MENKIAMYLMNKKGHFILSSFLEKYDSSCIKYVVTSEDKNVTKDYHKEIVELCKSNNIAVYDRTDTIDTPSEYAFAIGWRWIIDNIKNLIVFHDSLLPKYRGFAPLVNSLINMEKKIGVTALYASSEYDRGDIISQREISIEYPLKIEDAIDKISLLYFQLVNEIADKIIGGVNIESVPQEENYATYSLWRDEDDYMIDWEKDSTFIKRFIDSTGFPYKGASTYMNGLKIRVLESELVDDVIVENRTPGKVIFINDIYPIVVCGSGLLKLLSIRDDETNEELIPIKRFRVRFK